MVRCLAKLLSSCKDLVKDVSCHGQPWLDFVSHAWATRDLRIKYEGPEEYKLSDHKPQVVHIELETQGRQEPMPEGFSWHMMDKDRVAAEAAHLRCPTDVNTAEEIDRQLDLLIEELQRIVTVSIPR
jgi:hypothetical protein